MNISFYNAYTALKAHQRNLNQVSHNLANISTHGYKSGHGKFADLLYTQMDMNDPKNMVRGHGVKMDTVVTSFKQGGLDSTNQPLDFALLGSGFFAKQTSEGIVYTRQGSFRVGTVDQSSFLVDPSGNMILDRSFQPIELIRNQDGSIKTDTLTSQIGIFEFDRLHSLVKVNDTSFIPVDQANEALASTSEQTTLVQGALEMSNVEMAEGMVALIEGQKAFQLNARVIQTADQLEDIINNLR